MNRRLEGSYLQIKFCNSTYTFCEVVTELSIVYLKFVNKHCIVIEMLFTSESATPQAFCHL